MNTKLILKKVLIRLVKAFGLYNQKQDKYNGAIVSYPHHMKGLTNTITNKTQDWGSSVIAFGLKSAWMGVAIVYTGLFLANGATAVPVQDMILLWGVAATSTLV